MVAPRFVLLIGHPTTLQDNCSLANLLDTSDNRALADFDHRGGKMLKLGPLSVLARTTLEVPMYFIVNYIPQLNGLLCI